MGRDDAEWTWNRLSELLRSSELPDWLAALLRIPFDEVWDRRRELRVSFSYVRTKQSYLDWLQEQIELSPRGPEWSEVLEQRKAALQPFLGEQLFNVSIGSGAEYAIFHLDPNTEQLVHLELT